MAGGVASKGVIEGRMPGVITISAFSDPHLISLDV